MSRNFSCVMSPPGTSIKYQQMQSLPSSLNCNNKRNHPDRGDAQPGIGGPVSAAISIARPASPRGLMRTTDLIKRSLRYYWRTNLAVVFGVATAVAVLAGALLVGDSVRASLRDLFLQRLGQTDHVIAAPGFFREQLTEDIRPQSQPRLLPAVSLIELEGTVNVI